jgi:hypothetical protein
MRIRTWECALAVVLAVCGAQAGWAADWFVAPNPAGLGGGDGTKEKPFHDPYLAFRVAAAGDVIHIAAGTYYGRYDRAAWVIDRPRLTVRGGYDRAFTKRAPWETPTVFAVYKGYEGPLENNMVTGNRDHTGLVLDGLMFDRAGRNNYRTGCELCNRA